MEVVVAVLLILLMATVWWVIQAQARINKLEWWVQSLEERKADKGSPIREILPGDEWKHGIDDGEEEYLA